MARWSRGGLRHPRGSHWEMYEMNGSRAFELVMMLSGEAMQDGGWRREKKAAHSRGETKIKNRAGWPQPRSSATAVRTSVISSRSFAHNCLLRQPRKQLSAAVDLVG